MSNIKFWTDLREFYRNGPVLDQSRKVGTVVGSVDMETAAKPLLRLWLIVGFIDVDHAPWVTVAPEVSEGTRLRKEIIVQPEALDVRVRPLRPRPIAFDAGRAETVPYRYERFWAWRPTGLVTVNPIRDQGQGAIAGEDVPREPVRLAG